MAIKGKKKSRGGAPPRRPAGAPRPVVTSGRSKTPWYRTRDGILILSIFVLVAIGVAIWLYSSAREEARQLEAKQDALQAYTEQVGPVLQSASEAAGAMTALTQLPEGEELTGIQEDVAQWQAAVQQAQVSLTSIVAPPEAEATHQLFNEAFALYGSAASTFGQVSEAKGEIVGQLFATASTQRDLATSIFESAIAGFDTLRDELDLPASRLSAPTQIGGAMSDPGGATETEVETEGEAPEEEAPHRDGKGKKGKGDG